MSKTKLTRKDLKRIHEEGVDNVPGSFEWNELCRLALIGLYFEETRAAIGNLYGKMVQKENVILEKIKKETK